eukprot:Rhum_TRINITY_DN14531_c8_g1::Rhum_TRINITY_DN14531_c8_g1_i2::g.97751::m.97751
MNVASLCLDLKVCCPFSFSYSFGNIIGCEKRGGRRVGGWGRVRASSTVGSHPPRHAAQPLQVGAASVGGGLLTIKVLRGRGVCVNFHKLIVRSRRVGEASGCGEHGLDDGREEVAHHALEQVLGRRRRAVHLDEPHLRVLVHHEVEAEQLEAPEAVAVRSHGAGGHLLLGDEQRLLDQRVHLREQVLVQRPPVAHGAPRQPVQVLLELVVPHFVPLLEPSEVRPGFLDAVVRQVRELVRQVARVVALRRRPHHALLVHEDVEVRRHDTPRPQVELPAADQEGSLDVLLRDVLRRLAVVQLAVAAAVDVAQRVAHSVEDLDADALVAVRRLDDPDVLEACVARLLRTLVVRPHELRALVRAVARRVEHEGLRRDLPRSPRPHCDGLDHRPLQRQAPRPRVRVHQQTPALAVSARRRGTPLPPLHVFELRPHADHAVGRVPLVQKQVDAAKQAGHRRPPRGLRDRRLRCSLHVPLHPVVVHSLPERQRRKLPVDLHEHRPGVGVEREKIGPLAHARPRCRRTRRRRAAVRAVEQRERREVVPRQPLLQAELSVQRWRLGRRQHQPRDVLVHRRVRLVVAPDPRRRRRTLRGAAALGRRRRVVHAGPPALPGGGRGVRGVHAALPPRRQKLQGRRRFVEDTARRVGKLRRGGCGGGGG